jgi:hypothetical protein
MTTAQVSEQSAVKPLTSDAVLRIAREDAERVYRNLAPYRISLVLEADGWHVEYRLKEQFVAGGGPQYVICPVTGAILSKTYYQ